MSYFHRLVKDSGIKIIVIMGNSSISTGVEIVLIILVDDHVTILKENV
jgi:hypothetical protein